MALNKIPLGRTIGIIQAGAVNIPGGSVDAGGKKFNIKTTGDYSSLNDIKNLPIVSSDNKSFT